MFDVDVTCLLPQRKCFDAPLQAQELEGIKEMVRQHSEGGVRDNGLTEEQGIGFFIGSGVSGVVHEGLDERFEDGEMTVKSMVDGKPDVKKEVGVKVSSGERVSAIGKFEKRVL